MNTTQPDSNVVTPAIKPAGKGLLIYFVILEALVLSTLVVIPLLVPPGTIWPGRVFLVAFGALAISTVVCYKRPLASWGVVVMGLAIVGAMTIPDMAAFNRESRSEYNARDVREHAQSLVKIYHEGAQAGIVWPGSNRKTILGSVMAGKKVTGGVNAGKRFGHYYMPPAEVAKISRYIGFDSARGLFFDESGRQPGT